jgi:hypothetical protein
MSEKTYRITFRADVLVQAPDEESALRAFLRHGHGGWASGEADERPCPHSKRQVEYIQEEEDEPFGSPVEKIERVRGREYTANEHGNRIYTWGAFETPAESRYFFDGDVGQEWMMGVAGGWRQYDTDHDASYFGVWVNHDERLVLDYTEGDVSLVVCPTAESFQSELVSLGEFYGTSPALEA